MAVVPGTPVLSTMVPLCLAGHAAYAQRCGKWIVVLQAHTYAAAHLQKSEPRCVNGKLSFWPK